jgi:hypothetical protein
MADGTRKAPPPRSSMDAKAALPEVGRNPPVTEGPQRSGALTPPGATRLGTTGMNGAAGILALQRIAGNDAVRHLLRSAAPPVPVQAPAPGAVPTSLPGGRTPGVVPALSGRGPTRT